MATLKAAKFLQLKAARVSHSAIEPTTGDRPGIQCGRPWPQVRPARARWPGPSTGLWDRQDRSLKRSVPNLGGGLTLTNGPIDLDHADSFPRFFFSFREVDEHTRTFLKWRHWKERTFPHALEAA